MSFDPCDDIPLSGYYVLCADGTLDYVDTTSPTPHDAHVGAYTQHLSMLCMVEFRASRPDIYLF